MSGTATSGRKLTEERKALLAAAVEDGWPIRQIISTYGIATRTVKKHYPDYRGQSVEDMGELQKVRVKWQFSI